MPYIAFDLDALKHVPDVARAAEIRESEVGYGLLRLWAYCWTSKTDVVTAVHLAGFFGTSKAGPALVAFEHLHQLPNGYRVRGAERYLRISQARSEGGKKSVGNLKKGAQRAQAPAGEELERVPGSVPAPAGEELERVPGSVPALTPSTEHRTPSTEIKRSASASPKAARETDSLCSVFQKVTGTVYAWNGAKDGAAFAWLKTQAPIDEICRRFEVGLRQSGWRHTATVAQLRAKWNDLAVAEPGKRGAPVEARAGEGEITSQSFTGSDW